LLARVITFISICT